MSKILGLKALGLRLVLAMLLISTVSFGAEIMGLLKIGGGHMLLADDGSVYGARDHDLGTPYTYLYMGNIGMPVERCLEWYFRYGGYWHATHYVRFVSGGDLYTVEFEHWGDIGYEDPDSIGFIEVTPHIIPYVRLRESSSAEGLGEISLRTGDLGTGGPGGSGSRLIIGNLAEGNSYTVGVYNILGNILFSGVVPAVSSEIELPVDISAWPSGTYWVKVILGSWESCERFILLR